jgi:hypothetical protein
MPLLRSFFYLGSANSKDVTPTALKRVRVFGVIRGLTLLLAESAGRERSPLRAANVASSQPIRDDTDGSWDGASIFAERG